MIFQQGTVLESAFDLWDKLMQYTSSVGNSDHFGVSKTTIAQLLGKL